MKIKANNVDIEVYDSATGDSAAAARPAVLLIMGLGMQLVAWPPSLIASLVSAGYRVITFDNRDVGLSQHFGHLGTPNIVLTLLKIKMGFSVKTPYSLDDMAADSLGVLDALGIAKAHIVGVSMGGMIAQRVVLRAPDRVISLTSIMSSSGAKGLPGPEAKVQKAMLSRPADKTVPAIVDHFYKIYTAISSPAFPSEEAYVRENTRLAVLRNHDPAGTLRQMLAITADTGKRADALATITAPTLVLHGKADPLVPFACGEDTAKRIPGATLVGIEGMGHDWPPGVVTHLLAHTVPHFLAADLAAADFAAADFAVAQAK